MKTHPYQGVGIGHPPRVVELLSPPTPALEAKLAEAFFVEGHADGGLHAEFFEGADFAAGGDAAGRDDGEFGGGAEIAKPTEIRADRGALAVHVGAEEAGAVRCEAGHDFPR